MFSSTREITITAAPKEGRKYAKFVQVEKQKVMKPGPTPKDNDVWTGEYEDVEIVTDLPIGAHFNDGTGALFYINKCGLIPYDQYMAEKHIAEVKRKAENIDGEINKELVEKIGGKKK